jgi:hypothetical protein
MTKLPTEHEMCESIAQYLRLKSMLRDLFFHVPNGGRRRITEAVRFKKIGVRAGVPDYFIPLNTCKCKCSCGGNPGLFLEIKRGKRGVLSPEQLDYMERLTNQGYAAEVARSVEDAIEIVEKYIK